MLKSSDKTEEKEIEIMTEPKEGQDIRYKARFCHSKQFYFIFEKNLFIYLIIYLCVIEDLLVAT